MKKYSVIIPVYNVEKYLDRCILSLLKQSYEDFELILVNDCSTDKSLEVCRQYEKRDSRVFVLNQEKNQGVSAARNRGIVCASGKYILFIDSDDFVTDDYFETLDLLTAEEDDELISFGHYDYKITCNGEINVEISHMNCNIEFEKTDDWNKIFLKSFFASSWNKIFLKSILLQYNIRFDQKCVCYEDYLFNIEYCKYVNKFKCVEKPLYYYRQIIDINHVSKRKWGKRFEISEKVAKKTDEFIDLKSENENLINLRRYTYQSFLIELEAAVQSGTDYKADLDNLINNRNFLSSINSISPIGKKLRIFKYAKKLKLKYVCKYIIRSLINER